MLEEQHYELIWPKYDECESSIPMELAEYIDDYISSTHFDEIDRYRQN